MTSSLRALTLASALGFAVSAAAQTYTFTTIGGAATPRGSADGAGSNASFNYPTAGAFDAAGNLYVTDTANFTVRKITPAGVVTTFAGQAGKLGSIDGQGSAARFSTMYGIAIDGAGNLFVPDYDNHTIRRITPTGLVSTFAGTPGAPGATDGTGTNARFRNPVGVAFDSSGNLFVADRLNATIRKITTAGVVSTVAGLAGVGGVTDGAGSNARFYSIVGLACDASDNLYVAENNAHVIRKVTPAGVVSTFAGLGLTSGTTDGVGNAARFLFPNSVAVDGSGNVFVADTANNSIRKITPTGTVTTFAGRSGYPGSVDGTDTGARFYYPYGVTTDRNGNVYVIESGNHSIRRITSAAVTSTFAGPGGNFGSSDGTGAVARFYQPTFLAVDSGGNVFVSDTVNTTIRKITPAGAVSTFVGAVGSNAAVDGTGAAGRFNFPVGLGIAADDTLYAVDQVANLVRRITPGGAVTTIAGTLATISSGSTDGDGITARFNSPRGNAVDRNGNTYVADYGNHLIRKVTPAGVVSALAGQAGVSGSTDGAATSARFNSPYGVAVDAVDNVYVADTNNSVIRKITPAGVVSTLAGQAGAPGTTDGVGSAARFAFPLGLAADAAGNIFVADSSNSTIRRITPAGVVTTIGGAPPTFTLEAADGTGNAARFNAPIGITVDRNGALYIADSLNNRIVKGVIDVAPAITVQPRPLAVTAGTPVTFNVTATGGGLSYQWFFNGNLIDGATSSSLTLAGASAANAGAYTVAVNNSAGSLISSAAAVTLVTTTDPGRISNLAIRSQAGTGGQTLIVGLALGGANTSGTKPVLIRGVGPALGAFGLTGFLADPKLEVFASTTGAKINENDNWGGDAQVSATSVSVGAFNLGAATSRDAALYLPSFPSGSYTVQVSGANGSTGVALAEIYDATAAGSFTPATPRLINVSARTQVGTGGDVLIAGFYLGGQTARAVLIRAIGPTLAVFGLPGTLDDPKLELFSGQTKIHENDNWGGAATLSAAFGNVGAFPLAASSKDAALLITLPPGGYTVQVSGVGATTGVALVEVYEIP